MGSQCFKSFLEQVPKRTLKLIMFLIISPVHTEEITSNVLTWEEMGTTSTALLLCRNVFKSSFEANMSSPNESNQGNIFQILPFWCHISSFCYNSSAAEQEKLCWDIKRGFIFLLKSKVNVGNIHFIWLTQTADASHYFQIIF